MPINLFPPGGATLSQKSGTTLAYVSPAFPSRSMVFEQNELLGLQAAGADVSLLSCRRPANGTATELHEFARPLLEVVSYFSATDFVRGLVLCLLISPVRLLRTAAAALSGFFCDRNRRLKYLASWCLAVGFSSLGRRKKWQWIHADFGQGSATTAWYISCLLNKPFSFKMHAFDIYSRKVGVREADSFFLAKVEKAAAIFCVSEFGCEHLLSQIGEKYRDKIIVHRIGIRPEVLKPLPLPSMKKTPTIVALGRLEQKKGFDVLLHAIALLLKRGKKIYCEIYGGGKEEACLRNLIMRLGIEEAAFLKGIYQQEQLPNLLKAAVAVVVPSVQATDGDMDGIPTVIFEAMALNRSVLASSVSGIPEVILDGKTGLLVEPNSPQALADALEKLVFNESFMENLSRAAREYVERNHDYRLLSQILYEHFKTFLNTETSLPKSIYSKDEQL